MVIIYDHPKYCFNTIQYKGTSIDGILDISDEHFITLD